METLSEIETRLKSKLTDIKPEKILEDSYVLWENHLLKIYIKSPFFENLFKSGTILKPNNSNPGDWTYGRTGYRTGNLDNNSGGYFYDRWGYVSNLISGKMVNPYIFATVGIKDGMLFETGHFCTNPKADIEVISNNVLTTAKSIHKAHNSAILYKIDCSSTVLSTNCS